MSGAHTLASGAQVTGASKAGVPKSGTGDADAGKARSAALRRAIPQWVELASGLKESPARNPSLPTLVGLLILIMCFFVVLTSVSLRDRNRVRSVMSSLEQTFSGQGAAPPSAEEPPDQQARRMLGDLRANLSAEVPLVSGVAPAPADELVLMLPRNLVFVGAGPELAPDFQRILGRTLAALKTGPTDFVYEVEVAISAPRLDQNAVASGAAVEAALRSAGFLNDNAVVSLSTGDGATVALEVKLRPDARLGAAPGAVPGSAGGTP